MDLYLYMIIGPVGIVTLFPWFHDMWCVLPLVAIFPNSTISWFPPSAVRGTQIASIQSSFTRRCIPWLTRRGEKSKKKLLPFDGHHWSRPGVPFPVSQSILSHNEEEAPPRVTWRSPHQSPLAVIKRSTNCFVPGTKQNSAYRRWS